MGTPKRQAESKQPLYSQLMNHVDRMCFGIAASSLAVIFAVAQVADHVDGSLDLQIALVSSAIALPIGLIGGVALPGRITPPSVMESLTDYFLRLVLYWLMTLPAISILSVLHFLYPPSAFAFGVSTLLLWVVWTIAEGKAEKEANTRWWARAKLLASDEADRGEGTP